MRSKHALSLRAFSCFYHRRLTEGEKKQSWYGLEDAVIDCHQNYMHMLMHCDVNNILCLLSPCVILECVQQTGMQDEAMQRDENNGATLELRPVLGHRGIMVEAEEQGHIDLQTCMHYETVGPCVKDSSLLTHKMTTHTLLPLLILYLLVFMSTCSHCASSLSLLVSLWLFWVCLVDVHCLFVMSFCVLGYIALFQLPFLSIEQLPVSLWLFCVSLNNQPCCVTQLQTQVVVILSSAYTLCEHTRFVFQFIDVNFLYFLLGKDFKFKPVLLQF